MRLDLLLTSEDGLERSAVELKYLTRLWTGEWAGERFELKDQGAQDIRAHDVVKDIVRVERFVAAMPGSNGAVVCVGNDPSYWNARRTAGPRTPTRSACTKGRSCTGRGRGAR